MQTHYKVYTKNEILKKLQNLYAKFHPNRLYIVLDISKRRTVKLTETWV